jgi:hypothetical protein
MLPVAQRVKPVVQVVMLEDQATPEVYVEGEDSDSEVNSTVRKLFSTVRKLFRSLMLVKVVTLHML